MLLIEVRKGIRWKRAWRGPFLYKTSGKWLAMKMIGTLRVFVNTLAYLASNFTSCPSRTRSRWLKKKSCHNPLYGKLCFGTKGWEPKIGRWKRKCSERYWTADPVEKEFAGLAAHYPRWMDSGSDVSSSLTIGGREKITSIPFDLNDWDCLC